MDSLQTDSSFCKIAFESQFDVVKNIPSDEKDLVYGYFRQQIPNAPELVTMTCLWFYFQLKHETYSSVDNFDDMNLKENVLRGIYAYDLEKPSHVQQGVIISIVQNNDVMVQAPTETGKTAAYSIAGLQILDTNESQCQLLQICPTRASAINTHNILKRLGKYLKNITTRNVIGGIPVREDIQKGVQIITGTPYKIHNMITRGHLKLDKLKLFVLDEADECFSGGFKHNIYEIMKQLPDKTQLAIFSRTMPVELSRFAVAYLTNPVKIFIKPIELTLDGIKHYAIAVEKEDCKFVTLLHLYETLTMAQSVVYCEDRQTVMWLSEKLLSEDFPVSAIHDDMSQEERKLIMKEFKSVQTRVLIATDLLGAGVDSDTMKYHVSTVINYDLPLNVENYIDRIVRDIKYIKYNRGSVVINFVTHDDEQMQRDIEIFYDIKINELPMDIDSIRD